MSDAELAEPVSRHSTPTQSGSPAPEEHSERSGDEESSSQSPEPEDLVPDSPRTEQEHVDGTLSAVADEEDVNNPLQDSNAEPSSMALAEKPVKPKSKPRPRSPTPLPPPPSTPITIRLEISLGVPSNYAVNILSLAKETGQRPPTPPPRRRDSVSGSDGEDDDEEKPKASPTIAPNDAPPPTDNASIKPRRRRRRADPEHEYYDLNDPFIDDSDLGVDAPTHFAQTKQKGFYVNSGDVTLVLDRYSHMVFLLTQYDI